MNMAGTPCPYKGKIGAETTDLWEANPKKRPDYKQLKRSNEATAGRWRRVRGEVTWVPEDEEDTDD